MSRFTAPLKLVCGWALYFLIFWAVFPLVSGAINLLASDTTRAIVAAVVAMAGFIYLVMTKSLGLLDAAEWLDSSLKPRPSDPANTADAEQVKGRAPGLSEHAPPFGQTEARAERTLEHPPP
ncbi:hypothetical protein VUJ49_14335 [Pseudomonas berkeleyensis]|uniref:Uncharacterized protein n=1 Tax=Pseudomonas berkeleyensis TaxID=2726956 RepID=A0A7G5DHJ2_9PSED|nr:hypothetical protein [Pseudomonas berkeleyensis]QMV61217.1 hypothetical protein HS968_14275 [Pseudomonas berkeleyensis]WSO36643.1 hypothetical protein VUJ49_14335 [Pseudomonas berkeleyensis]